MHKKKWIDLSLMSPSLNGEYEYKWFKKENYTLKGRLYPNKTQKKQIDQILFWLGVYYNTALRECKEGVEVNGEIVHKNTIPCKKHPEYLYPDWNGMKSKEYKKSILERYPEIKKYVPDYSITGNSGVIGRNAQKSFENSTYDVEQPDGTVITYKVKSILRWDPAYYEKGHVIKTFDAQIATSGFKRTANLRVLKINIPKVGKMTCRGLNMDIMLDDGFGGKLNFIDYCEFKSKSHIYCDITHIPHTDVYTISIKLNDIMQSQKVMKEKAKSIGIDMGFKDTFIMSNGLVYPNNKYMNAKLNKIKGYSNIQKRRQGNDNEKFREQNKKIEKENEKREKNNELPLPLLKKSHRYQDIVNRQAKLYWKIHNRRMNDAEKISSYVVSSNEDIVVETLKISEMGKKGKAIPKGEKVSKAKQEDQKKRKRIRRAKQDSNLSNIAARLKGKARAYGSTIYVISPWIASSQTCHVCGYVNKEVKNNLRTWTCPVCHTQHNRDINAAINIHNVYLSGNAVKEEDLKEKESPEEEIA